MYVSWKGTIIRTNTYPEGVLIVKVKRYNCSTIISVHLTDTLIDLYKRMSTPSIVIHSKNQIVFLVVSWVKTSYHCDQQSNNGIITTILSYIPSNVHAISRLSLVYYLIALAWFILHDLCLARLVVVLFVSSLRL